MIQAVFPVDQLAAWLNRGKGVSEGDTTLCISLGILKISGFYWYTT